MRDDKNKSVLWVNLIKKKQLFEEGEKDISVN